MPLVAPGRELCRSPCYHALKYFRKYFQELVLCVLVPRLTSTCFYVFEGGIHRVLVSCFFSEAGGQWRHSADAKFAMLLIVMMVARAP